MKPNYREIALAYVRAHPGASGFLVWMELQRHSRAAKWFGEASTLTAIFGPSSGMTYVALASLEREGLIWSTWGPRGRSKHRPRLYYPSKSNWSGFAMWGPHGSSPAVDAAATKPQAY